MTHLLRYALTFSILNLSLIIGYSQVAINENNSNPDASAMLDISSSDKGILIPRMGSTDRENISNPAKGLMVFDSTTNSFWYYSDSWQEIGGAFISKNNIITSVNNNDGFVVGADSLNHGGGDETKMFFDNISGAFRAGQIRGKNWDADSLGSLSFGWGFNTKASGSHATAFGANTIATDYTSTAFGIGSIASGYNATAFGWHSTASGISTTAFGREAEASGYNATAVGSYVTAPSYAEVVIGTHNTNYTPNDNFYYHPNDRLFVVGNGTGPTNRSDALRIYKNGNIELNGALTIDNAYTLPVVDGVVGQVLTTDGSGNVSWSSSNGAFNSINGITSSINNNDDFLVGADSLNYASGLESKLFYHKNQRAFRAGSISNNDWDRDSLGFASFAAGADTQASGDYSVALGTETTASGFAATALGSQTIANGFGATAIGNQSVASGSGAVAIGLETEAIASGATALGTRTVAEEMGATALGIETTASANGATAMGENTSATASTATAFGFESTASGQISTAFGLRTVATNDAATAFGNSTEASGAQSTAFGSSTTASEFGATAFGVSTKASGLISTSFGYDSQASSYGETAMGMYNTIETPLSSTNFVANDRLFVIGNGANFVNRSDALRIYKNGNAELNGALTIDSAYTFPVVDGTNGQVLATDGNGNVAWASTTDNDNQVVDKFQLAGTTLNLSLENDGQNDYSVDLSSLKDNLGNHIATQNLQLSDNWISNDGGDEGIAIDNDGNVSTSGNLGIGGALSAQKSLSLFDGNQNVILSADNANRRVILDVGGSGASSDAFIIGDLTNGVNEVLMLGNVGIGTFSTPQKLTVGAQGDGTKAIANNWEKWSDIRLKRDIQEITDPIAKLNAINGYYYYWKQDKGDQTRQVGVIAQEVEAILPELVTTNTDGYKSVDYDNIVALLIEVNQAQQKEIEALKVKVAKISQLEAMLKQLQKQFN